MQNQFIIKKFICFIVLLIFSNCANYNVVAEPSIQTDDLFKINLGMTKNEVVKILGNPLFYETISEEDEIITKYMYNFKTIVVLNNKKVAQNDGRSTLLQFLFINDNLISWEEDKLTLSQSKHNTTGSDINVLGFLGLLLNLIIIIKIF